ncbi:hypothetical protein GE118_01580 [Mycoplasma sp. NEAQ87857]|uniref:hypothetical protein n=1 Tax=Mycoplasma sp. NEAQ87857 TaxID=2683967 RepID=UPI00131771C0|nr:hypothetical protein [Mycoplasma sp. NEAQ87857]QGZ97486.1 hypothetical protein GE118_01580 [Mycoplasma sp. NEAQ87857]
MLKSSFVLSVVALVPSLISCTESNENKYKLKNKDELNQLIVDDLDLNLNNIIKNVYDGIEQFNQMEDNKFKLDQFKNYVANIKVNELQNNIQKIHTTVDMFVIRSGIGQTMKFINDINNINNDSKKLDELNKFLDGFKEDVKIDGFKNKVDQLKTEIAKSPINTDLVISSLVAIIQEGYLNLIKVKTKDNYLTYALQNAKNLFDNIYKNPDLVNKIKEISSLKSVVDESDAWLKNIVEQINNKKQFNIQEVDTLLEEGEKYKILNGIVWNAFTSNEFKNAYQKEYKVENIYPTATSLSTFDLSKIITFNDAAFNFIEQQLNNSIKQPLLFDFNYQLNTNSTNPDMIFIKDKIINKTTNLWNQLLNNLLKVYKESLLKITKLKQIGPFEYLNLAFSNPNNNVFAQVNQSFNDLVTELNKNPATNIQQMTDKVKQILEFMNRFLQGNSFVFNIIKGESNTNIQNIFKQLDGMMTLGLTANISNLYNNLQNALNDSNLPKWAVDNQVKINNNKGFDQIRVKFDQLKNIINDAFDSLSNLVDKNNDLEKELKIIAGAINQQILQLSTISQISSTNYLINSTKDIQISNNKQITVPIFANIKKIKEKLNENKEQLNTQLQELNTKKEELDNKENKTEDDNKTLQNISNIITAINNQITAIDDQIANLPTQDQSNFNTYTPIIQPDILTSIAISPNNYVSFDISNNIKLYNNLNDQETNVDHNMFIQLDLSKFKDSIFNKVKDQDINTSLGTYSLYQVKTVSIKSFNWYYNAKNEFAKPILNIEFAISDQPSQTVYMLNDANVKYGFNLAAPELFTKLLKPTISLPKDTLAIINNNESVNNQELLTKRANALITYTKTQAMFDYSNNQTLKDKVDQLQQALDQNLEITQLTTKFDDLFKLVQDLVAQINQKIIDDNHNFDVDISLSK